VLHGFNLRLYLKLGMTLVRIKKGVKFYQSRFIKPFIDQCTERRKSALTATEQNMWKTVAVSAYGKVRARHCMIIFLQPLKSTVIPFSQFIEGYEKRMDCRFNRDGRRAMRNSSSPLYKGVLICDEELTISFHKKKAVRMTQCWPVGFSILEISKYVMQSLYYEKIIPKLGSGNVSVVMSDTDSFLVSTNAGTEHEVMSLLKPYMDLSNLDKSHPLYDDVNEKVPGYLKNEVPKASILEVVALQSKTYGFRTDSSETVNRAKGVVQAVKKRITLAHYKACLQDIGRVEVTQRSLQSKAHINMMIESDKVAFSSFDDKRYLLCAIHSCPYGSWLATLPKCYFCTHPNELF
jgi:hypothetical protein